MTLRNLPNEWKMFSECASEVILQLGSDDVTFEEILCKYNLQQLILQHSNMFLKECLLSCLSTEKQVESKFIPFLRNVVNWLLRGKIGNIDMRRVHQGIIQSLVDIEEVDILSRFFSAFDSACQMESTVRDIHNNEMVNLFRSDKFVDMNSPALISACAKNHHDIVQLLVSKGYR